MNTAGITLQELLADNEASTGKWQACFQANPAALDVPCDIYNSGTVRGMLKHIFAVELRHSQRLLDQDVVAYDAIPVGSLDDLVAVHAQATANLHHFLAHANDAILPRLSNYKPCPLERCALPGANCSCTSYCIRCGTGHN